MALKIAVCIKQVPESMEVDMDEKKGLLLRQDAKKRINPFDLYALEAVTQLKYASGGSLIAFTMGPESAREVLRTAAAFDADKGVLISDPSFSGADVLATSKTLADAISLYGEFDIYCFGMQTTDGDTGQVAAEVAAMLGINYISNVNAISLTENKLYFERRLTGKIQSGQIDCPCALSITSDFYVPHIPSLRKKMEARKMEFDVIDATKIKTIDEYGLKGSPTSVKRIYPVSDKKNGEEIYVKGREAFEYILSQTERYTGVKKLG